MSVSGRIFVALVIMSCSQAFAETELDQFFPSSPTHEDDRLSGNFEAVIKGCNVKLTEFSGSFATISLFDVQSYETDPGRLVWPYGNKYSTRYNVAWSARAEASGMTTEELNAKLRELRISWRDNRTLGTNELQAKSKVLEKWLSEIQSGGHGSFAQRNHTARYLTTDEELLVSVRINAFMEFPVRAGDMSQLAHAMYRHGLTCR